MSIHLKDPAKFRSTATDLRQAPAGKENADSNIIRKRSRTRSQGIGEADENYLCQEKISNSIKSCLTPKSKANKIPIAETCPLAPRKPIRRAVLSCKRKLMPDLEFFEADRGEEVDEFFRSSFERISAVTAKRKVAAAAADSSSSSPTPPCNYV